MSLSKRARQLQKMREQAEELEVPQDLRDRFEPYRADPVEFVEEILGVEPAPYQRDVLSAAVDEPRIAWRAAHGVGKTATLSWVVLWFLLTRPFSRVLIVAPAFERQVGRYLLPEVKKWARRAPESLPVDVRANTVEVQGFGREWFAAGVQASDPSKIEGAHAESVAILADEAKGLPADVVAALHGTQTDQSGDRLYLLASVPGGPSGPFYDSCRADAWRSFHTAAEDSSLVSPTWIEERAEEWGEGSPLYVARVEGQFPAEDENTLFPLSDLEAAVERSISWERDETPALTFGVDPARHGNDRSALAVWRGPELLDLQTRQGLTTVEVASWVASEANRRSPSYIMVDEIGIGAGVLDRLKQLNPEGWVEGVNVGSNANRTDLHKNRRAEIFWDLKQALERGEVSLPQNDDLVAELSGFRYDYAANGKIELESKSETRKRVGRSPDLADAVALGFAAGAGRAEPRAEPIVSLGGDTSWRDQYREFKARRDGDEIEGHPGYYITDEGQVYDEDGTNYGHISEDSNPW